MKRAAFISLLFAASVRADTNADQHMLAGAGLFQGGRFNEALVEFRVAERLGDAGAIWYVAATLVKLKRPEEALAEFALGESRAPEERDGLLDYYHALACYDARLYVCADRLLAALGEQPGPRIAAQAKKIRADLAPVLAAPPPTASIDWYHAKGQVAAKAGNSVLAVAYFEEAASLAAMRSDAHRRAEALASLARLRPQPIGAESSR